MINVDNLYKSYGQVHALDGLNLEVEPGVVYGFLGPNGAGKTTTLRILSGLARADRGKALILNQEVRGLDSGMRAQIGVLPEEPAFYPWLTPREYLARFVAPLYHIDSASAFRRADELLATLGLEKASRRRIGGFSRGMRQRLGLAQALIHQPKVLLLDEPVSALDPAGRKEILDLIESLRGNTTILLSTHILADVERTCDVIGIISTGRMLIEARREELLDRYATPVFEVEAENGLEGWVEGLQRLSFVRKATIQNHHARVLVDDIRLAQKYLLNSLAEAEIPVRRFELTRPSLEEVFLRLTESANEHF
jgi:ABC-2 type transport system ATP-binding protein